MKLIKEPETSILESMDDAASHSNLQNTDKKRTSVKDDGNMFLGDSNAQTIILNNSKNILSLNKNQRKIEAFQESSRSFGRINDKDENQIYTLSPPSAHKERGPNAILIDSN